ncbi:tetratricopeptide repeat protein, partial [bacterium]|nr:tetratricopeptide repeat protein [bacterium]
APLMGGEAKRERLLVSDNSPKTMYDMANYVLSEAARYTQEENYDMAAAVYGNIIDMIPAVAPSLVQRGRCHWEMHRWDEALKDFQRAVQIDPQDCNAAWTLGLLYLQLNNFEKGWPLYEQRWKSKSFKAVPLNTTKPQYDLSKTGRVLVWPEQGLGDQIIYASLLNALAERAEVTVMVDSRLIPPLSRAMPHIKFMAYDPNTKEPHDYHIPLASLGSLFIQSMDDIHSSVSAAYMAADPERTKKFAEILEIGEQDKLIGLSWMSHAPVVGKHKSCTLEDLEPILAWGKANGYKFIGLDYVGTPQHPDVIDPYCLNMFIDIGGVCALIERCAFLVSVSNVNVHYAGAMGMPVYLLDANKLWYWNNRHDKYSYWYPSVSVYPREHVHASWNLPVRAILEDIRDEYDHE